MWFVSRFDASENIPPHPTPTTSTATATAEMETVEVKFTLRICFSMFYVLSTLSMNMHRGFFVRVRAKRRRSCIVFDVPGCLVRKCQWLYCSSRSSPITIGMWLMQIGDLSRTANGRYRYLLRRVVPQSPDVRPLECVFALDGLTNYGAIFARLKYCEFRTFTSAI